MVQPHRGRRLLLSLLLALGAGCSSSSPDASAPVGESAQACEVLPVFQARCITCHGETPTDGAPMSLTTLEMLRAPSLRDAKQTFAERSLLRMKDASAPMPPSPFVGASASDIETVASWISGGMPNCKTDIGHVDETVRSPNLLPQDSLFACTNERSDAPTRLRRINRWQWARNVGGAVSRSWTGFSYFDNPLDPSITSRYGSYSADETVDDSMVEILLPIVEEYGGTWAGPYTGSNRLELLRTDQSLRCMWSDDKPTAKCIEHYVATLLQKGVLYRPPTNEETQRLAAFAKEVLDQEPANPNEEVRTHSLTRVVTAASMTTGALFRQEMGTPDGDDRVALSQWELAQQMSYALGDRGPGAVPTWRWPEYSAPIDGHYADIVAAAEEGTLGSAQVVDALVKTNVGGVDPTRFDLIQDTDDRKRSRRGEHYLGDGVANFFRQWLGYTRVTEIFKERPEASSAYDDGEQSGYRNQAAAWDQLMGGYYGYESTLIEQMDDFVASVVDADKDVLQTLLTSRRYFLAATKDTGFDDRQTRYTGQPYGTVAEIDGSAAGARWRTFPANERAGVLTHPAWLASHGGNFEDDPSAVHRGKWVRENLLCGYVPPLSEVRVEAKVGPHAADKNARTRLEDATGKQACQTCHSLMNPLGYTFEIYNHAGYLRAHDRSPDGGKMTPDGKVTLTGMPDPALNGVIRDAVELSEKLADSAWVKRCFIRHTFRYFMGRDENRSDACTLTQMEAAYDGSNGSFRALLSSLMTSDTWTTRRAPTKGE